MLHHVSPDQLRIGMYVYIDLPWFLHPFTLNSFRISSEAQVAELRALKLERFRYDPARSDVIPAETAIAASAEPVAPVAEIVPQCAAAHGEPLATEQEERTRQLREHRLAVTRTEKAFVKASGVMRRLSRNLRLRPKEALAEMHGLVEQMASVFLDHVDLSLHVMGENCGGEEAYFHGLNVSVLSLMLAKKLDLGIEQARILGIGALLHDIGQIEIPEQVLRKSPEEYTLQECALRASHVELGVRIGKQLELAPEALAIIAQHHELADGSGYPREFRLDEIAPLARVVSLVNFYDNLCNPTVLGQALTPHEALSYIFARCRNKFDNRILQFLIRSLGVYPPGSIVKLSNGAIAMVISVNPKTALRPWLLLYHAGVPRHEASMLDLEQEAGVSIAKSLRPALLPPAVYAYLSPRKHITYFFGSEPSAAAERA
jgi:putative nucleotidyltransferase with HDIG domain